MAKDAKKQVGYGEQLIRPRLIRKLIRRRPADGHKYTFGHCLLIAGSEGKAGAAIIAAKAALRTGCGLVTVCLPEKYEPVLLNHMPEAMMIKRNDIDDLAKYTSIAFGPGVGVTEESADILYRILQDFTGKLVIDADGLTLLSLHKEWRDLLSHKVILTPHTGEFDRLTGIHSSLKDRLSTQHAIAKSTGATVVLKGMNTTIATGNKMYINTTGNSGMATAGAGDALTGIIASLCAQGYDVADAAIMGVFLHGYAGDIAAAEMSEHSMLASDLTDRIGRFFLKFT